MLIYNGLNENKAQRDELCCTTVMLKANEIDVGIPTLETSSVFTKPSWENKNIFPTVLRDQEGSRDYLFFATSLPVYITFDKTLHIKWKPNARLKQKINGQEVATYLSLFIYLWLILYMYILLLFVHKNSYMSLRPNFLHFMINCMNVISIDST